MSLCYGPRCDWVGAAMRDLEAGKFANEYFKNGVYPFLASLGISDCPSDLFDVNESGGLFSLFNNASIACFMEHVAKLEGFADGHEWYASVERGGSKFEDLPIWETVFWVPVELPRAGKILNDEVMVAGCPALQRELALLQQLSPLGLGAVPPTYDWMRKDPKGWFHNNEQQLSEEDTIRWIWLALSQGAAIAMDRKMVLWYR